MANSKIEANEFAEFLSKLTEDRDKRSFIRERRKSEVIRYNLHRPEVIAIIESYMREIADRLIEAESLIEAYNECNQE
jgi:hypothetical protein